MKTVLRWLDHNFLTLLIGILIVVIPLYPKIPLGELIEGYIVRLRLEDLLILFSFIVWLIQLKRQRIHFPRHKVARAIMIYLSIAFLSTLSAIFITHTVPLAKAHILKIFFHFFRRVEYFSLFFMTYSAIRQRKDLLIFIKTALATLVGVLAYGIGQKYFYFPAFSTMNREFSKGVLLYLQPNTRLFSTFGGHYDLASYLMILLAFLIPFLWLFKTSPLKKLALNLVVLVSIWSLVLTTSRTSFIGYLVGLVFISIYLVKEKSWFWSLRRFVIIGLTSVTIMLFFSTLVERFAQVIPNPQTRETIKTITMIINQPFVSQPETTGQVAELPSLLGFLFKNEKPTIIPPAEVSHNQLAIVASQSDVPPSPHKPTPKPTPKTDLPSDVTLESEAIRQQTAEAKGQVYSGPSYSPNALKYGLSMGIRLDVLWPRAIAGFKHNPLLGTGYSTLVKSNLGEFTYAESTDNDYLRMLGETGLLGTLSFLAILYFIFQTAKQASYTTDFMIKIIGLGMMTAIISLLVNALYIDVFESSKIAYVLWLFSAMVVRSLDLIKRQESYVKQT